MFGAFGIILIFSALFRGFSTGRSTPFCNTFLRGMKDYEKFTTISNSVDTRGVCWLFGWVYFNDQSANKKRKKAENMKFEIWFTDDQDVHMRLQTLKVSLKMLISSVNHEVVCGDDCEIFVMIIEGNLEFDLILLQLWNKIALSSRWLPSSKSLRITSSFLSLCSHIEHKALKNVLASGSSRSYYNLRRIHFWEVEMDFPSHSSQLSLAFLLSKSVVLGT